MAQNSQSITSFEVRMFFHYMKHPSLVQRQMWIKYLWRELTIAGQSVQHLAGGIYGTGSADIWTCTQDLVKSMRCEHMLLLCRNSMLNHHCKMGFHRQRLTQSFNKCIWFDSSISSEATDCNVSSCAMLSPPPADFHGSQSTQSPGIYPPA